MFNFSPPVQQGYSPKVRQSVPCIMVKDFNDVKVAPIPVDGSQTMFMLDDEPVFYVTQMIDGRKVAQGFTFTAIPSEATIPQEASTVENRLLSLENSISQIAKLLDRSRSVKNEPDISNVKDKPTDK